MRLALSASLASLFLAACSSAPPAATGGSASTAPAGGAGGAPTTTAATSTGGAAATTSTTATGSGGATGATTTSVTTSSTLTVTDPGSMTSDARLYTTDGTVYLVDQVGDALTHALAGAAVDNVILYVHGRGCGGSGEPGKSLSGSMPEMEASYSARALMFNWQGSDAGCPLGFPEAEARAAGPALSHVLHELAYHKATHAAALAGVKLTLITHSMGNLVLEQAAETDTAPLPPDLFDTAIVQSSATARDGHDAWLAKVKLAPHLYVTENDGDAVLTAAGLLTGVRLGKNLTGAKLAANAAYVDFTAAGLNHAYYVPSGQKGAHMKAFYATVMNGLPYDFAASNALTSTTPRDGTFVYVFDGQ
jgi:hypothetical protein